MKNKTGQILLHITGCIAFLSLPVLLSPDVSWDFHFVKVAAFQEDFVTYTLLLLFFYVNYFLLVPRLYFKQHILYYLTCIVLCYVAIALLPHLLVPGNHPLHMRPGGRAFDEAAHDSHLPAVLPPGNSGEEPGGPPDRQPLRNNDSFPGNHMQPPHRGADFQGGHLPHGDLPGRLFRMPHFEYFFQFMMVFVLSALISINNRLRQTEKEKVNAELAYLKAQINPHFLFNTLNSIYAAAIAECADNTASAVVKLSGMMRYVISEAHHTYVPLQKELEYISDYIELQQVRLGNTVRLVYSVTGETAGKQIAPLILISFIENAFKHGVNPEENSSIDIDINVHDNMLRMSVLNNKVTTAGALSAKNNIGLENTSSRLQLLYPSRHELVIKNDEKEFLVFLKIDLQ